MLRKKDASTVRRERIKRIHRMLQTGEKVDYTKFLAICSYSIGLTDKTTKKYLRDLEALDFIEINEEEDWILAIEPKEVQPDE